ncbi:MAG: translocation/assembly module TamB [Alistipes sp.]|jgi:hypothetical protein|nr:translocation/assembly module TamB [Alistipes sp.]
MRKITKNIIKAVIATICGLLLLLLVAPLAVSLLVSVPSVQNAVVQRLTTRLSEGLGTKISIDRVDIRLVNRVEVWGFYVEDYAGDTLLWVPRIEAPIEKLGLGSEPLTFGRVRLSGGQIWLRKESLDNDMNISKMVDSISPGPSNPDPKFRMRIASIEGDSLTFGLLRPYRERREGVDFSRFVLRGIDTRIDDFVISRDTIRMNINSLRASERSGWSVDNLSAHPLIVSRGAVTLKDVEIRSEGAELQLPSIRLKGQRGMWRDFTEFSDSVAMEITMRHSRVTTGLVGAFVPRVGGFDLTLDQVDAHTSGVLSALSGGVGGARTHETAFAFDFTSRGLPQFETAQFDARITNFESTGDDVMALVRAIAGGGPSRGVASVLGRMGVLSFNGELEGGIDDFAVAGTVFSVLGVIEAGVRLTGVSTGTAVDGRFSTARFDLGRTLGINDMGALSGGFTVGGTLGKAGASGTLHGDIGGFAFRGYTYTGLSLDATLDDRRVGVNFAARDPNLEADLAARLDLRGDVPACIVDLNLGRADLSATRLNRADSVSTLSGRLRAAVSGHTLADAEGSVELRDATYRSAGGAVSTTLATLEASSSLAGKLLALRSEFVDAESRSQTGYLHPEMVSLRVKEAGRLLETIAPTAAIAPGSEAHFNLDRDTGAFSLTAFSEFVEYRGILAAGLSLTAAATAFDMAARTADSLSIHLTGSDLYSGRGHISRFELRGGSRVSPRLDLELDGRQWRVEADTVNFAGGGVALRNMKLFPADSPGQRLVLSGTISPQGAIDAGARIDSLDGALLDPLLGGVLEQTQGRVSGRLTVGGTLDAPRIDGLLDVPRFETTIAYTGARYGVTGARLAIENSVLTLPRTAVSNPLGGSGDLSMSVDMSNLRNIRTRIDARTASMLAFDTGPGDSEAFYGRLFATGSATIETDRMGTRIDISARTDGGTQLHLPLNAKSNVSWADFVVFADNGSASGATGVLERKRLLYERRLSGGSGARRKPLELNLSASVTPAAEIHMLIDPNLGQGISGRGEGVIDMRINPANNLFTMTGDYNISSGRFEFSMMDVFNKTFEIAPGSTLRWSGAADDALLSVDASYRVRTSLLPLVGEGSPLSGGRSVPVDCIIRLRESLSDPEITFDISLPSADADARQIVANAMNTQELKSMQFLSLLTTGSFATDNSITGQSANAGVMATGAVGFDILTNQLTNFLSSEDYAIFFRYRPQDNFASNQVEAGFSTRLWNDRLQLEIEGNWVDNRAATTVAPPGGTTGGGAGARGAAANLAGDVSLTWVIDRAGNLRLKVFSQTIDRLNETQGLQESGLGIHYKKDFDSFGDIFRRKSPNFVADSVKVSKTRKRKK